MLNKKNLLLTTFTILVLLTTFFSNALCNEWPTEETEITMVIPFGAGGSTDDIGRKMMEVLGPNIGAKTRVENRLGGATIIANETHLRMDPADGTYMVMSNFANLFGSILLGGDYTLDSFDYLGLFEFQPYGLFVGSITGFETLPELIEYAREHPGELTYSYTAGSLTQVASELLFSEIFGVEITPIPYDGGGERRASLIAGDTTISITGISGTLNAVDEKDVRLLANMTNSPHPLDPDAPLINDILKEMGYEPMAEIANRKGPWIKKPFKEEYPERFESLVKAFAEVVPSSEVQEHAERMGYELSWIGPDKAIDIIKEEFELYEKYKNIFEE
jgi:tripartite-type tricarboxylate transporter receptor subunit TctC